MGGIRLTSVAERQSSKATTYSDHNIVVLDPKIVDFGFGQSTSAILDEAWLELLVEEDGEELRPQTEFPTLNFRPGAPDRQSFMKLAASSDDERSRFWIEMAKTPDTTSRAVPPDSSETIWATGHLQQILAEPVGSPFDLSLDEARAVLRAAFGTIHDLPQDDEFHIEIAESLGHSIMDDVNRSDV